MDAPQIAAAARATAEAIRFVNAQVVEDRLVRSINEASALGWERFAVEIERQAATPNLNRRTI